MEELNACILCESRRIETRCPQNAFSQCRDCQLVFDNPRPQWSEIVSFYSQHDKYDDWLKEEKARDDLWERRWRRVRRHKAGGTLLDVGAGIGQFLNVARKSFQVAGTEISPVARQIAATKYGIDLHLGTVEMLARDGHLSSSFDVITLFHVLEHVPYPAVTLRACDSLLKPQGALVIAVPNDVASLLTRRNRVMERAGFAKYRSLGKLGLPKLVLNGSEIHLSHFTSEVLGEALRRMGLDVVENSLDPFFSVQGFRKVRRYRRYYWYKFIHSATAMNLYDTMWVVARRP